MEEFNYNSAQLPQQHSMLPEIVSFATDSRQRPTAASVLSPNHRSTPVGGGNSSSSSGGGGKLIIGATEREDKVATTLGSIAVSIQRQHEKDRRVSDINDLRGTITVPVSKRKDHQGQQVAGDAHHLRHFDRSVSLEVRRLLSQQGARNRSPQRKQGQQQGKRPLPAAETHQVMGGGIGTPTLPTRPSSSGAGSSPSRPNSSVRVGGGGGGSRQQQHQQQHHGGGDTESTYSSASGSNWNTAATETGSTALVYGADEQQHHHSGAMTASQQLQLLQQQQQQQHAAASISRDEMEKMLDDSSVDFLEALNNTSIIAQHQQQQQQHQLVDPEQEEESQHMRDICGSSVTQNKSTSNVINSMGATRQDKMALFQNAAFVQPRNSRSTPMTMTADNNNKKRQNLNATVNFKRNAHLVQEALETTRTSAIAMHALDAESPVTRRRRRFDMLRSANIGSDSSSSSQQVQFKTPAAAQFTYVRTFQSEPAPPAAVVESAFGTKRSLLEANRRGGVGAPKDDGIFPCPDAGHAVEELIHPRQRYRRGSKALLQTAEGKDAVIAVTDECCIQRHTILDDAGNPISEWPSVTVSGTGFRNGGKRLEAALGHYRVELAKTAHEFWSKRPSPPRRASLIEKEVARQRKGLFGHSASARSAESGTPPHSGRRAGSAAKSPRPALPVQQPDEHGVPRHNEERVIEAES